MPTFDEYLSQITTYARAQTPELTDLQPGSIQRSLFELMALHLELLYFSAVDQAQQALGESAYRVYAFNRRPAVAAAGAIRLTATATIASPISIPAGTQVRVPGTDKIYRTLEIATFPAGAAGSTVDLQVAAVAAGSDYNTAAATIREFINPLSAALSVSNPSAVTTGRDEESDDERRQRFATYLRSLHRATAEAVEYAAEQAVVTDANGVVIESVADATVIDSGDGNAVCYIANGSTAAASAGLIATALAQVNAYKAAGVTISVQAAARTLQAFNVQVRLAATSSLAMVQTTIRQVIADYMATLGIGDTLYIEQVQAAILRVPGVVDVLTVSPAANVVPAVSAQIVLSGTPTVSLMP